MLVIAGGGVAAVSTPVVWLLDGPGAGQLVGAAVQGAAGVAALVRGVLRRVPEPGPTDTAIGTGRAEASGGGRANTGVRRPGGAGGGSATARDTGDATATGPGSRANTGVDHSPDA
ncbi:hypothetical protein GCM10027160_24740 [Streptomyces calidiresistens]